MQKISYIVHFMLFDTFGIKLFLESFINKFQVWNKPEMTQEKQN